MVVEVGGRVAGYASLSVFRERPGHSNTADVSVCVHRDFRGIGDGTSAVDAIVLSASRLGYRALVAAIVPPNAASEKLLGKSGFARVGRFRAVGLKFSRWRDVDFYQKLLTGSAS